MGKDVAERGPFGNPRMAWVLARLAVVAALHQLFPRPATVLRMIASSSVAFRLYCFAALSGMSLLVDLFVRLSQMANLSQSVPDCYC